MTLTLSLLSGRYAVCRFESNESIPVWATRSQFFTVTRTTDELSITCPEADVPRDIAKCERGWRAFKLHGPFDFGLTGILVSVLNPLAEAGVGIFAVSTFDTDYVLMKEENVEKAIEALRKIGHIVKT